MVKEFTIAKTIVNSVCVYIPSTQKIIFPIDKIYEKIFEDFKYNNVIIDIGDGVEYRIDHLMYEPDRFPGLIMKIYDPVEDYQFTFLIFKTGTIISVLGKYYNNYERMGKVIYRILNKYGAPDKIDNKPLTYLSNIVLTVVLGIATSTSMNGSTDNLKVNLENLYKELMNKEYVDEEKQIKITYAEYDPTNFPGLILKVEDIYAGNIYYLIFNNAKIVYGVKTREFVDRATEILHKILKKHLYKVKQKQ